MFCQISEFCLYKMRDVIFEHYLNLHIFCYEWYGERIQKLRACATLVEDQSLNSRTHSRWLGNAYSSGSGESEELGLLVPVAHIPTHRDVHKYT